MTVPIEPGWLSLLPPLAAIALALLTREVVLSLFAGVWLGALLAAGFNPVTGTIGSLDLLLTALADADHIAIIAFSLLLGGMVGVISRSGGSQGVVEALAGYATNRRRGQFFAWFSAIFVFFDDYANTLIRGNSLRPMTDRLRISREKLAYIVDSTAAPLAVIGIVTTWIGFEITQIRDALRNVAETTTDPVIRAQLLAGAENPFTIFLDSVPYLFYPIFALFFVLMIVVTKRDFGPMLAAERRAAAGQGLLRPGAMPAADTELHSLVARENTPHRWYNAAVPVLAVIVVALVSLYQTGAAELAPEERTLRAIIGEADPFKALLWASFTGCVVAITMATTQRILSLQEALGAWIAGMQSMLLAMVILVLAWGLGGATGLLGTGPYLAGLLGEALPLAALPALVFLVAAATAFATGTSWGTMAILFPVVIPLAVAMGVGVGFAGGENYGILLGTVSSVMAGAVFGDHSSPISDTTVLSSMASACDHIDHVRTQLPYALVVAAVAMAVGELPAALGLNPWISVVIGLAILYGILLVLGKRVEDEGPAARAVVTAPAALEA
jgi:Na+/H+ antiporter NhaC